LATLPINDAESFREEKKSEVAPCINDTKSRRLPVSTIHRVSDTLYQRCAELVPPGIVDSGESIFDYEHLRKCECKIKKATAIVPGTCAYPTYLKKSKSPSPWYIPLRARVNSNGFYIKKNIVRILYLIFVSAIHLWL
jgi:hypothetical protein